MTTFDFDDDGSHRDEYAHLAVYVDPDALREEIIGGYFDADPAYAPVREWALTLSVAELGEIGEDMIQDDRLWDAYRAVVIDGLVDAHRKATKDLQ